MCLLLTSVLLGFGVAEVYTELERYTNEIKRLYDITYSSTCHSTLRGLEELSSAARRIGNALCHSLISWMGLYGVGKRLAGTTSNAAYWMRELQYISERL
uniref:Uncharacterized protein n=1 Tax=Thermosphaera aggregans TaxID=54254 RepID=A0A7C2FYW7_9CREN